MFWQLRRSLEEMLGVEPVAAGEDTHWQIRYALGWPDWLIVLFAVAAVAAIVVIYLRESAKVGRTFRLFLASVRLAVVAMVLLMLGGLELVIDRTSLPYLVFLVDDSESMSIKDEVGTAPSESGAEKKARLAAVQEWLGSRNGEPLRELTHRHKIQLYSHSADHKLLGTYIDSESVDAFLADLQQLKPVGQTSKIGTNLRAVLNALRGTPPSAVVLVTDGVVTEGEPLSQTGQYAARKNIPIFTIGVGNPGELRDREIRDLLVDETVFVGDLVTFEAKLSSRGGEANKVPVQLIRKSTGDVMDQKDVDVPPDGSPVKIELSFRPDAPGSDEYELVVAVDPDEIAKDNNRLARRVEAIKEKIRVLYVESYPRYEFRFLKSLLEREETIELSVLLADSDPEYIEEDQFAVGYFPTTKEEIYEYDVVILGDVATSFFSAAQLENLREFVRAKGGGLLFIAGPNFSPRSYRDTPLEELLPVELGSTSATESPGDAFRPRMTLEGRSSPIFRFGHDEAESVAIFDHLPPAYWYANVDRAKPAAIVLAEHPGEFADGGTVPLVVTQYYGAGRTFYQGFTGTWRWRRFVEDLYLSRYWIQSVRLLSRSKLLGKNRLVEVLVDRRAYRRGDPVQVRVRLLDESLASRGDGKVTVQVERSDGARRTMELARRPDGQGIYEGVFGQTEDGTYSVRLIAPSVESAETCEFQVTPPPGELDRVQMNEIELSALAEATGGKYSRIADADRLLAQLPSGRKVALHTDAPIELWNKWPVLVLFAGLLALEWILRKRKSLV